MGNRLRERLLSHVSKASPDGCWLWTGATRRDGYGCIKVSGKMRQAHQISWELDTGQTVSAGKVVRHKCDTPPCVNPAHLEIGTVKDNVQDSISRGRHSIPRLDALSLRFIRHWLIKGYTQTSIAEVFGVNQSSIARHGK